MSERVKDFIATAAATSPWIATGVSLAAVEQWLRIASLCVGICGGVCAIIYYLIKIQKDE